VDGGYNYLMIDGDVYLTGSRHPLSGMRPLESADWHIQFQSDYDEKQESWINIGWYWTRPTPVAKEFFLRSQRSWDSNQTWDQAIMNQVRFDMMYGGPFTFPGSMVLNLLDYRSTMLFDWSEAFVDEKVMNAINRESVIVHYTMLFGKSKEIAAKQFGHWLNETYYVQNPKILQPLNLVGTTSSIMHQIAFSVHLANVTGRSFMWPTAVNHTCTKYKNGWKLQPPILIAEADNVTVPWVEGRYLQNRARYTTKPLPEVKILFDHLVDGRARSLEKRLTFLNNISEDLLIIDFAGMEWEALDGLPFVQDVVKQIGLETCAMCGEMGKHHSSHIEHVVC